MSYRVEPEFSLDADPKRGTLWNIYRGSDAYMVLNVKLPDIDAPITSDDTVSKVIAHIRENKGDALPKIIFGNTDGRTGATLTRPEPNLLKIVIHATDTQTQDSLDLAPRNSPTTIRQEIPGDGFFDVLLEDSGGDRHYIFSADVKAYQMVTRPDDEP